MDIGLIFWLGIVIISSIVKSKKKAQTAQKKKPVRKEPPAPWEGASSPARPAKPAAKPAPAGEWEQVLRNASGDVADVIRSAIAGAQAKKPAAPAARQPVMPLNQAMTPTVHAHVDPGHCETHDAPGSLGGVSTEGIDPCHEEQLGARRSAVTVTERPGLALDLSGQALTQAFIMQEVLTRPAARRPRGCAR